MQDSPFPAYSEVKADHVVPGIRALLAELHAEVRTSRACAGYYELQCRSPGTCHQPAVPY